MRAVPPHKMILLLALTMALALCGALPAAAKETHLPDSLLIDDDQGISVDGAGDYFMEITDLKPGDVITRTLTVRNLEQDAAYTLFMTAEPLHSTGPIDWLDHLHLTVTVGGEAAYRGRVRGDGKGTPAMDGGSVNMIADGVNLGTYARGEYGQVEFKVVVDGSQLALEDLAQVSEGKIAWNFYGVQDADSQSPQTGSRLRNGLYMILLGVLLALCIVLIMRQKKQAQWELRRKHAC